MGNRKKRVDREKETKRKTKCIYSTPNSFCQVKRMLYNSIYIFIYVYQSLTGLGGQGRDDFWVAWEYVWELHLFVVDSGFEKLKRWKKTITWRREMIFADMDLRRVSTLQKGTSRIVKLAIEIWELRQWKIWTNLSIVPP